ncbi:MAG: thrombospondin type 3 repeat-containing protein [Deltaproteobacteria bacterium]|nr:thrombospondin type 3 repeat-containing protein [Deltaproteobacteria bacterium]
MFGTSEGRVISRAGIAWGILSSAEQTRVTAFYRFGSSSYVGTNEGLFFISNNSFEKALNVGLPEDWVTDLLAFDGHLFVSYRSKGIFYKKDADALFKSASDGLGSLSITDLIEYNDTLLAATPDKNIYSLNKSKWESFKPLSKPATKLSADRSSLYALIENQVYEIHFQTSPGDATPPSPPPSTEPELPPASTPPSPPAADTDGDGVVDASDNCPKAANVDQKDDDADGIGNVCDPDFTIVKATTPPTGGGSGCSLNASAQSSVGFIWFFTLFFFMGLALRLRPQRIKKN